MRIVGAIGTSGHGACFCKTLLLDLTLALRYGGCQIVEIVKTRSFRPGDCVRWETSGHHCHPDISLVVAGPGRKVRAN
jgi:hypothetical protein